MIWIKSKVKQWLTSRIYLERSSTKGPLLMGLSSTNSLKLKLHFSLPNFRKKKLTVRLHLVTPIRPQAQMLSISSLYIARGR